MLLAAVVLFFAIRAHGEALSASPLVEAVAKAAPGRGAEHVLFHVLLALAVVVAVSRALGVVFRRLGQPAVIGEVIAGILLGPSFFGQFAPELQAYFFPTNIAAYLGVVAEVGVILFMFLVGLELDTHSLRERSHTTLAISHASMVLPFLLGALLSLWLYPALSSETVGFTNFSLFMGVSLSVTAFPVLARILADSGLSRSHLGAVALACAAVGDATAWCLLAVVVGIVRASSSSSLFTLGFTLLYVALMLVVIRPVLGRWVAREEVLGRLRQGASAFMLIALLVSALLTEAIGIHALFGAFLLGAIVPHESLLAREMTRRLEDLVVVLLLPAFFALTGLRTELGLLQGVTDWVYCGVIVLAACVGKLGGSALAARLGGLAWRDSCSLGVLLNTRGLMELVVLNVGLDLGVISPRLFAMLVIMAVVTTLATAPLLKLLNPAIRIAGAANSPVR
jgi:Kef-type K+ transport system membrane component KefB